MKVKRLLAVLLTLTVWAAMLPIIALGEETQIKSSVFVDMPDDWSKDALEKAIKNQLLNGYDTKNGKEIRAQGTLSRAEMATIINRAFGESKMADISTVTDIKTTDWFADQMAKAVSMGTFMKDTKMRPNDAITRQEAFTVIARALCLTCEDPEHQALNGYSDKDAVAEYAKEPVCALIEAGYINGDENHILSPLKNITRAEFAKMMDNIISQYISEKGTFTTTVSQGNVCIRVPDVTLKNVTINGDLIIGEGADSSNIHLENVTITGRLLVRADHANVYFKGTTNVIYIKGNDTKVYAYKNEAKFVTGIVVGINSAIITDKTSSGGGGGGGGGPVVETLRTLALTVFVNGEDNEDVLGSTNVDYYFSDSIYKVMTETITKSQGTFELQMKKAMNKAKDKGLINDDGRIAKIPQTTTAVIEENTQIVDKVAEAVKNAVTEVLNPGSGASALPPEALAAIEDAFIDGNGDPLPDEVINETVSNVISVLSGASGAAPIDLSSPEQKAVLIAMDQSIKDYREDYSDEELYDKIPNEFQGIIGKNDFTSALNDYQAQIAALLEQFGYIPALFEAADSSAPGPLTFTIYIDPVQLILERYDAALERSKEKVNENDSYYKNAVEATDPMLFLIEDELDPADPDAKEWTNYLIRCDEDEAAAFSPDAAANYMYNQIQPAVDAVMLAAINAEPSSSSSEDELIEALADRLYSRYEQNKDKNVPGLEYSIKKSDNTQLDFSKDQMIDLAEKIRSYKDKDVKTVADLKNKNKFTFTILQAYELIGYTADNLGIWTAAFNRDDFLKYLEDSGRDSVKTAIEDYLPDFSSAKIQIILDKNSLAVG